MRSLATTAISLALITGFTGCAHAYKSDWDSPVVDKKENPRNGQAGFGPNRAEVVKYHCGSFHHQCITVRFVDETGFNDMFTYVGDEKPLSMNWKHPQTLEIKCSSCDSKMVKLRRPGLYDVHITYDL